MPMKIASLDHLVLSVADIDASIAFYTRVLGMEAEVFHPADGTIRTALKFGAQKINLHLAGAPFRPHAQNPVAGSGDLCFLIDGPLDAWISQLNAIGVEIEEGPVARSGAVGPIRSVYVRDPDANLIELSEQISPA